MKTVMLRDVAVGKSFVFAHRMYVRTGFIVPEGYNVLVVPCVPVGVIRDSFKHYLYCFTRVEV